MPFVKGQSGNPNGRPKKGRALTELLEQAGKKGKRSAKLVEAIWQLATEGQVTLGQRSIKITDVREWTDVVKFLHSQIDGPPKQAVELSGQDGGPIKTYISVSPEMWDDMGGSGGDNGE